MNAAASFTVSSRSTQVLIIHAFLLSPEKPESFDSNLRRSVDLLDISTLQLILPSDLSSVFTRSPRSLSLPQCSEGRHGPEDLLVQRCDVADDLIRRLLVREGEPLRHL